MDSLIKTLNQGSERVEGAVVYIENRAVGLIRPSLVEGIDSDNFHYFGGPAGISIVRDPDKKECIIESLIEADGVIFGCGGIGSMTALQLAGSGIGSLTIIDDDVVEKSNLNRQYMWTNSDIGRSKVDVLVKAINDRFQSKCEGINEKVSWQRYENFIGPSFGPMNMEIAAIAASAILHRIAFPSAPQLTEENESKEYSWKPCYYA